MNVVISNLQRTVKIEFVPPMANPILCKRHRIERVEAKTFDESLRKLEEDDGTFGEDGVAIVVAEYSIVLLSCRPLELSEPKRWRAQAW
jgi:hypothetical protein